MDTTNFPFEMRESKFVPGHVSLAIKEGKVTYVAPTENKTSTKYGEKYTIASLNVMIAVPGATSNIFLSCKALGVDAKLVEEGKVKQGDTITCLLNLDIHSFNGKSYQDVNISEIEVKN